MDFKTEKGKLWNYGIHEHNSGLAGVTINVSLLERLIDKGAISFKNEEIKEMTIKALSGIKSSKIKCREAIDYLYQKSQ